MAFLELIVALTLGLFSAFVAGFLIWHLAAAITGSMRYGRERWSLKTGRSALDRADRLLADKNYKEALQELRAVVLFKPFSGQSAIPRLRAHYDNVLSRVLIIAEQVSPESLDISTLERLFHERIELLSLNLRAESAYQKLLTRREASGKDVPPWSKEDFEKKSADIRKELSRNGKELKAEMDKLAQSLEKAGSRNEIVYH